MGRMYTAIMTPTSITVAKTLIRITAPTDAIVVLHEFKVTQELSETSEQLPIKLFRASTSGTGTAVAPQPLEAGDAVFGGTVAGDLTVEPTLSLIIWQEAQNVLNGWHYLPPPESRLIVSPGLHIAIRLETAPAAALTFTAMVVLEEIGG